MPAVKFGNVWSWADDLDGQTLAQAQRTAQLPFVVKPVTLMPDAHFGYGVCVGAVIATRGAVIPSAVGVDIGCGMIAALTDLFASDLPDDRLKGLNGKIGLAVPSGTGQGHKDRRTGTNAQYRADKALGRLVGWEHAPDLNDHQRTTAIEQFGSLGSGNHFVEIDLDEQGRVWVVLHSGSRGIGNQLANIHIDGAKGLMKGHFATPEDEDLASLVEGTPEFDAYIEALLWSQDYAAGNREQMMTSTLFELFRAVGKGRELERINCHHNYAQRETHEGRDLWVTRKGAI